VKKVETDAIAIPVWKIEKSILQIRGLRVMVDADLATLYGVTTKALNQAVKRNKNRFPADFMIQLSAGEKQEVVTICDHLSRLRFSPVLPYAFTEHGVLMLANVLNSERAVHVSVQIVRAFVRLRETLFSHTELTMRMEEMERKYDEQFKIVFEAIRQLMTPPTPKKKEIGFRVKEPGVPYAARKGKK
jgi:hypothetical protein